MLWTQDQCRASRHGGAIFAANGSPFLKGHMKFNKAAAQVGGGLSVYNGSLNASQVSFFECHAQQDGAMAFVRGSAVLQHVSAKDCAATMSGFVVSAFGDLHVASLATSSSDRQWLNAAGAVVVGSLDCGCEETCAVRAQKGAYVTKMSCSPGTGVRSSNQSSGSVVGMLCLPSRDIPAWLFCRSFAVASMSRVCWGLSSDWAEDAFRDVVGHQRDNAFVLGSPLPQPVSMPWRSYLQQGPRPLESKDPVSPHVWERLRWRSMLPMCPEPWHGR